MTEFEYCVSCDYLKFSGLKVGCYIKHDPKECSIAVKNKQITEYEQAKADLKAEFEKPFIKIFEWLENKLEKLKGGAKE